MLGYLDVRCPGQDAEVWGAGACEEAHRAHAQQVCHYRLQDPHHRLLQLDNSGDQECDDRLRNLVFLIFVFVPTIYVSMHLQLLFMPKQLVIFDFPYNKPVNP